MELTDAQVLAQLKMRKVKLSLELERVNIAIKAFEEVKEIDPLDAAPYLFDEVTPADDELAIATLMYNPHSSFEKKVQYVLAKIGKGTAHDITQYLLRIDKGVKDERRLYSRITYVASRLFNQKIISAEVVGRKNVYALKE
jgi:hypothetical protein